MDIGFEFHLKGGLSPAYFLSVSALKCHQLRTTGKKEITVCDQFSVLEEKLSSSIGCWTHEKHVVNKKAWLHSINTHKWEIWLWIEALIKISLETPREVLLDITGRLLVIIANYESKFQSCCMIFFRDRILD